LPIPLISINNLWSRGCKTFSFFNNKPVGIVDITPCGGDVEVAVLVIDAYQGRGIGKAVVFDFAERLGKMGYRHALAYASPENYKALAIVRKIGAEVRCRDILHHQVRAD
jgi:ribosomal protein S18 acetylase RimI-like enzyme